VALELHEHELLLLNDSVLAAMLNGRELKLTRCCGPFRPEGGAYNTHQHS
jgi:urease accessory protein